MLLLSVGFPRYIILMTCILFGIKGFFSLIPPNCKMLFSVIPLWILYGEKKIFFRFCVENQQRTKFVFWI